MFGRKVLVPLLAPLLQQHPQLQVEAVLSDRLVDLVEEGFDAALRTGVIADQRIVARPLRPLRWVTVASPRIWPAVAHRTMWPRCGSRVPGGAQPAQWPAGGLAVPAGGPTARLHPTDADGVRQRRSAGRSGHRRIGIVQVMDFAVADALADGRLQRVLQPLEGRSRALSLIYPPSRQHSPKLQVLADALLAGDW